MKQRFYLSEFDENGNEYVLKRDKRGVPYVNVEEIIDSIVINEDYDKLEYAISKIIEYFPIALSFMIPYTAIKLLPHVIKYVDDKPTKYTAQALLSALKTYYND